ncbi:DNA cytosine methyltransferase [bacterium]|nr:MAG: DNA cytosine methyltransferase [bacterium]
MTYIDLFAGAGGLSEGFIRQGYEPIAHVESDKAACYTLKTRISYYHLINNDQKDIYYSYLKGEISRDQLYSYIPEEKLNSVINAEIGKENNRIFDRIDSALGDRKIDLIIGGPPCQAYSLVGRAPLKHREDDERTALYIQYGRFLKKYKPKVFIFENVPGILTAGNGKYYKNVQRYYKRIGYNVEARKLNSYDFGVIQNRERIIIIGWLKELEFSYPVFEKNDKNYLRDDIFSDLPKIKAGEKQRIQKYIQEPNEYLSKTQIRNGIDFVCQHITRPHNKRDLKIYKLAINLLKDGKRIKNNKIPEELRTQKNVRDFLDRFKVVDSIPHTMIAHIAKDGHYFIHPDEKQLRSISVREAARIQSFPDDYYFEGVIESKPRTSAFRQIGNAVPPLMAESLAKKIVELFYNKEI